MRGRPSLIVLHLTPDERTTCHAWQRKTTQHAGLVKRGRILLLVAEGHPITQVARQVGCSRRCVYKWIARFQARGLPGLRDAPGRGGRPHVRK